MSPCERLAVPLDCFAWMAHPACAPTRPIRYRYRAVTQPMRARCESCGAPVADGERLCLRCAGRFRARLARLLHPGRW